MTLRSSPLDFVARASLMGVLMGAVCALTGCAVEQADDEDGATGVAEGALQNPNALNPNALNPNALNPNALNPNALNPNALNPNALNPNALAAITDPGTSGDMSRQLLRYVVSCALDATQSFSFSWTDSQGTLHQDTYMGLMGLEPLWASQPLSAEGGRWISACLASRTNWFNFPITLSSRGAHPQLSAPSSTELRNFSHEEGSFWGDLFSATPALYACNYVPNERYSRMKMRDCATGHLDSNGNLQQCGILQLAGSCDLRCDALQTTGKYRTQCAPAGGAAAGEVITVFLQ